MPIQEAMSTYSGAVSTASTGIITITGTPTFIVPQGFEVSTVPGAVSFDTTFLTDQAAEIEVGGTVDVGITAQELGKRPTPAGSIVVIDDPVPEVVSVFNAEPVIAGIDGGYDFLLDSVGDVALVDGSEEIILSLIQRLQFIAGEWIFDIRAGIPYFNDVFTRPAYKNRIDGFIKAEIIDTEGVKQLLSYTSEFNYTTRNLRITFQYSDIYNTDQNVDITL